MPIEEAMTTRTWVLHRRSFKFSAEGRMSPRGVGLVGILRSARPSDAEVRHWTADGE